MNIPIWGQYVFLSCGIVIAVMLAALVTMGAIYAVVQVREEVIEHIRYMAAKKKGTA